MRVPSLGTVLLHLMERSPSIASRLAGGSGAPAGERSVFKARAAMPLLACLTRHSSGPACGRPLSSNVRPPRRPMSHRHAPARLPSTNGAVAESALGCPSAGGQRTIGLSHQVLSQSSARASESRMAQGSVQRLEGRHSLVARLLVGAFTFASHRRPNPAIELTASSGLRPPPASAHVKR